MKRLLSAAALLLLPGLAWPGPMPLAAKCSVSR
jgi:hypothetical protein